MKLGGRERIDDAAALEELFCAPPRDGGLDGRLLDERLHAQIICPEPDKPAVEAADFCRGYLHGARMHEKWRLDEVATEKLLPFEALAKEDEATHREHLGSYVTELHTYWKSKRQVVNATPKVGRNEPSQAESTPLGSRELARHHPQGVCGFP